MGMSNLQPQQGFPPSSEEKKHYSRGWTASKGGVGGNNGGPSKLERADMRHEHPSWYDGYTDYAIGLPKGHSLTCKDDEHKNCGLNG